MGWMEMGDSSEAPPDATHLPAYAFYIGGDTPHVWTVAEVFALDSRYALPIWTRSNPGGDAADDANGIIAALHLLKWSPGSLVAVDTETAIIPGYVAELDMRISDAGYALVHYASKDAMESYPATKGGRWVADWTGLPHLIPGSVATQYASATMAHGFWDQSVIDDAAALHEIHPPAVHTIPAAVVQCDLPQLSAGDTGPAVRRLQGLLLAWRSDALNGSGMDGQYGPDTAAAVTWFRRMYGITADPGQVNAETWERLLTG